MTSAISLSADVLRDFAVGVEIGDEHRVLSRDNPQQVCPQTPRSSQQGTGPPDNEAFEMKRSFEAEAPPVGSFSDSTNLFQPPISQHTPPVTSSDLVRQMLEALQAARPEDERQFLIDFLLLGAGKRPTQMEKEDEKDTQGKGKKGCGVSPCSPPTSTVPTGWTSASKTTEEIGGPHLNKQTYLPCPLSGLSFSSREASPLMWEETAESVLQLVTLRGFVPLQGLGVLATLCSATSNLVQCPLALRAAFQSTGLACRGRALRSLLWSDHVGALDLLLKEGIVDADKPLILSEDGHRFDFPLSLALRPRNFVSSPEAEGEGGDAQQNHQGIPLGSREFSQRDQQIDKEGATFECARLLIQHGAPLFSLNAQTESPLSCAVRHCTQRDILQSLAKAAAKDDLLSFRFPLYAESPLDPSASNGECLAPFLWTAVQHQNGAAVEALIGAGADPNDHSQRLSKSPRGAVRGETEGEGLSLRRDGHSMRRLSLSIESDSPLTLAVKRGDAQMIPLLVHLGARVDLWDGHGDSALHVACALDDVPVLRLLLQCAKEKENNWEGGQVTNLSVKDSKGRSPVHLARSAAAFAALFEYGASPNEGLDDGTTPLLKNVRLGKTDAVTVILQAGGDVHVQDEWGESAASLANRGEILRLIVEKGADPRPAVIRAAQGKSGISVESLQTALGGREALCEVLREQNEEGKTPLFFVSRPSLVSDLLSAGALPHLRDKEGRTFLDQTLLNGALIEDALKGQTHLSDLLTEARDGWNFKEEEVNAWAVRALKPRIDRSASVRQGQGQGQDGGVGSEVSRLSNLTLLRGTPLLLAAAVAGEENFLTRLLSYGANPKGTDRNGSSILHLPQVLMKPELVHKLISSGGFVQSLVAEKDAKGRNPYEVCVSMAAVHGEELSEARKRISMPGGSEAGLLEDALVERELWHAERSLEGFRLSSHILREASMRLNRRA
uniref:Uncharacterized protein n=1 Tax=Chromera velia CCMP2878 TaxID=1169474 RepID=A0A0G4H1N1_9ALVE|eukprot:Cvel_805.t1-p1 / transcript=Cvel_805.t1 / gene=Cvel_805 / organism=Chromera_velia_CCMP2878 / gene_product=Ankyrin repeat and SOCS box protein 3, putative / transcript_product=Ankyrin repeat and SOCS box protein 3, putative / location=Cvel_scaffold25:59438-63417(+) / protein_length=954 / sequence_SO=supercontig / SO=protein_coding / is_pseudo=false